MITAHTSGPWTIGTSIAGGCDIIAGRIGERIVVARAVDNSLLPLAECAHNARLIAAAPMLLEAMSHLLDGDFGVVSVVDGDGWLSARAQARAAIAAAKGE